MSLSFSTFYHFKINLMPSLEGASVLSLGSQFLGIKKIYRYVVLFARRIYIKKNISSLLGMIV